MNNKKIYKYDGTTGNLLASYNSRKECALDNYFSVVSLCNIIKGRQKTIRGDIYIESDMEPAQNIFDDTNCIFNRYLTIVQESTYTGFRRISTNKDSTQIRPIFRMNDDDLLDFIITELLPYSTMHEEFSQTGFKEEDEADRINIIELYFSIKKGNRIKHTLYKQFRLSDL